MTIVPKPLSAGLMMISSHRIRRFKARPSRLVKLSRILVGLAFSNCSSMVLENASNEILGNKIITLLSCPISLAIE